MKTILLAAALFTAPIIGVIAMNPEASQQSIKDASAWVKKSFPEPKPKKQKVRRRG